MQTVSASDKNDPSQPSIGLKNLRKGFRLVSDLLSGVAAMQARTTEYLPKLVEESTARYAERLECVKLTNVFSDIVEDLAQRPFKSPVQMADGSDTGLEEFSKNVDGMGGDIHAYGGEMLYSGIAYGIHGTLIDYPRADLQPGEVRSIDDEKKLGLRPVWRHYAAGTILEASTAFFEGREQFVRVRLSETRTAIDGFSEEAVPRVRVISRERDGAGYGKPQWVVWEKVEGEKELEWKAVDAGTLSVAEIPFELFCTSRRGSKGRWDLQPPMQSAADLQKKVYQQESALDHIKQSAAFPMIAGNGVTPQLGDNGEAEPLDVGPFAVLYAPDGSWTILEPSAASMKFLADDVKDTIRELRELGRQPLTANSGNLTVITTAVAADKGNSAVQAWALNAKASLERCLWFTAQWLDIKGAEPIVTLPTDFDTSYGGDDSFGHVLTMATGPEPMVSRKAALHEAKRRGVLDPDYDDEDDLDQIVIEQSGLEGEDDDDKSSPLPAGSKETEPAQPS